MSYYTKQKWFCMTCGKENFSALPFIYAGKFCNKECCEEFRWREALCILGKEYEEKKKK